MTPIIESASLSVRVGAKPLIADIALSIMPGQTVALVGPNGAGKSTLLRAFSGEISASTGTVKLKGRDPRVYRPSELALHRAVLSQHVSVAFPFAVREVVAMGAGERRGPAIAALVERALVDVDLEHFGDRVIGTLSGGEQQRAHLARVLVQLACGEAACGPGVLLLDEPTASLDLRHQLGIVKTIRQCAARGVTVVAILHDLNLAAISADRVVVLNRGKVARDGLPSDVITDDMLDQVFGVTAAVSRAPQGDAPFVLPHSARPTAAATARRMGRGSGK
jgi:iron complex transport system ATP-binding protein